MKGFPTPWLLVLLCVEAGAQPKPVPTVEDLEKANRAIIEALRRIPTVVENEITAGQLNPRGEHARLGLVQFYEGLASEGQFDALDFHFATPARRSGNARVDEAWTALSTALEKRQAFARESLPTVIEEQARAAAAIWRAARLPSDLSPAIEQLRRLKDLIGPFNTEVTARTAPKPEETLDYLEKFKMLLAAEQANDAGLIGEAIAELENRYQKNLPFGDFASLKELEERRKMSYTRLKEQHQAAARQAIATLLAARKAEDLDATIATLHEMAAAEAGLTGRRAGQWDQRFSLLEKVAIGWRGMLVYEAQGAWAQAYELGQRFREQAEAVDPQLAALLDQRLPSLEQKLGSRERDFVRTLEEMVSRIQTADDAAALLREAGRMRAELPDTGVWQNDLTGLCADLEVLARLEPHLASSNPFKLNLVAQTAHPWSRQVAALWPRLRRQAFAEFLRRPELLAAPLASLSLEEAMQTLFQDALQRKDWPAAYRLAQQSTLIKPFRPDDPNIRSIHALLVGQNYEKAGLFSEAAAHYREALREVSARPVVEEAAERLKELKKLHPEIF